MAERAIFIVGATIDEVMNGTGDPSVMIGVDVEWDKDMQSWRADWEGGVQFGESKAAAALNAFKQRMVDE